MKKLKTGKNTSVITKKRVENEILDEKTIEKSSIYKPSNIKKQNENF